MKTHTRGNPTHGLSKITKGVPSPLHHVWTEMRQRCRNPKSKSFKYYGSRGIGFYPPWNDFKVFHEWAMSVGYARGLTIERKNNDGNYEPANCCWIPKGQQRRNNRRVIKITYQGRTQILTDWAKELGIKVTTLYNRIVKDVPVEIAFQKEEIAPERRWDRQNRKKRMIYPERVNGKFVSTSNKIHAMEGQIT